MKTFIQVKCHLMEIRCLAQKWLNFLNNVDGETVWVWKVNKEKTGKGYFSLHHSLQIYFKMEYLLSNKAKRESRPSVMNNLGTFCSPPPPQSPCLDYIIGIRIGGDFRDHLVQHPYLQMKGQMPWEGKWFVQGHTSIK